MKKKIIITEMVQKLKEYKFNNKSIFLFRCYSDKMFTYGLSKQNVSVEVTFICDKFETLLNDMPINDLLQLKKTKYLSVTFYTDIQEEIVYNTKA